MAGSPYLAPEPASQRHCISARTPGGRANGSPGKSRKRIAHSFRMEVRQDLHAFSPTPDRGYGVCNRIQNLKTLHVRSLLKAQQL